MFMKGFLKLPKSNVLDAVQYFSKEREKSKKEKKLWASEPEAAS